MVDDLAKQEPAINRRHASLFNHEDGSSKLLRIVGRLLPNYTAL
jgi:hypothetical protein